jgi:hypothetical protein
MATYLLMFMGSDEAWADMPKDEQAAAYERIGKWFEEHGKSGKIVGGKELEPAATAKTVRFRSGKPVVTDGPFMESKEQIGGYAIVEAKDIDEAVEIAKGWPSGSTVEVRPVVSRDAGND